MSPAGFIFAGPGIEDQSAISPPSSTERKYWYLCLGCLGFQTDQRLVPVLVCLSKVSGVWSGVDKNASSLLFSGCGTWYAG